MDDPVLQGVLKNVKFNLPLGNLTNDKLRALRYGYQQGYFSNMHLYQIDSNHVQVEKSDKNKPMELTELGEKILEDLTNQQDHIGFRSD